MFQLEGKTGYRSALDDYLFFDDGDEENLCGAYEANFSQGKTDFQKLANDLKENLNNEHFIYKWHNYQSNTYKTERVYVFSARQLDSPIPPRTHIQVKTHKPFSYIQDGVKKSGVFNEVKLNKRKCNLDPNIGVSVSINTEKEKATFGIKVYYADTKKYRKLALDTKEDIDDFRIDDKYKAIILSTTKPEHFIGFIDVIEPKKDAKNYLKNKFIKTFKDYKVGVNIERSSLNWLYEITPQYILNSLTLEDLWFHLTELLQYDVNKWFIDSSNSMIKALTAICSVKEGIPFLYNEFERQPETVKKIYDYLDGENNSTEYNNQLIPNKTLFTSILSECIM